VGACWSSSSSASSCWPSSSAPVNGILISTARLQPFIVTLATWSIWGGVAFWLLPVEGGTPSTDLGLVGARSLPRRPQVGLGRRAALPALVLAEADPLITDLIAIGSDEERARLLGVHLARRKLQAYAFSAVLAALAGIWVTAQTEAGAPNAAISSS